VWRMWGRMSGGAGGIGYGFLAKEADLALSLKVLDRLAAVHAPTLLRQAR
jgi:hypothetical protein